MNELEKRAFYVYGLSDIDSEDFYIRFKKNTESQYGKLLDLRIHYIKISKNVDNRKNNVIEAVGSISNFNNNIIMAIFENETHYFLYTATQGTVITDPLILKKDNESETNYFGLI